MLSIMGVVLVLVLAGCGQASQPVKQATGPATATQGEKASPAPKASPQGSKDGSPASKPLQKITLSYSAVSMTWLPIKVAIDKGFFRDEGLEPQMVQMKSNVATTSLSTGDTDFAINISPVLNGVMQGLGLKLVAALNTRPLFSLMVRPEIKTANDLKGKVFAVNAFGNTQALVTEKVLQHLGLQANEYKLIAVGDTGPRLAAMEQNAAQGSLMPTPTNVKMENQGYRNMGNTADIVTQPVVGLGTNVNKLQNQRDMVKKTIRAALRGVQFILNNDNKDETIKEIMQWNKLDEKDAGRAYDLSKAGFSKNGYASDEDLSIEWKLIQEATMKTDVPVSAVADYTLLREVQQELGIK